MSVVHINDFVCPKARRIALTSFIKIAPNPSLVYRLMRNLALTSDLWYQLINHKDRSTLRGTLERRNMHMSSNMITTNIEVKIEEVS
jgi:hypothetical protein